ncbi:MAG: hypothetical protein WDL87_07675 [Candidatus Omnitrophota bacterium]|jgi:uncharacterized protein YceK
MKKKGICVVLGVFYCLVLLSGCHTVCKSTKGAVAGAKEGAKEDWKATQEADVWMKKNLW